jgi:hypothetical protein
LDLRQGSKKRIEKLNKEELHNLYCSPHIIEVITSRRVCHVTLMGEMRNAQNILVGKSKKKEAT